MHRYWIWLAAIAALRCGALPAALFATDCNHNGIEDEFEISLGSIPDANHNGIPDDCEDWIDCNTNGLRDADEPDYADCNTNQVHDACDADCDTNHLPDDCELQMGALDCNSNGVLDACEGSGSVRVHISDVNGWRGAAGAAHECALDVYFAGRYESRGALTGPVATLRVGDVDIRITDSSGVAAIMDGATNPAVSDAAMFPDQSSIWTFAPPISAFYCMFGSQAGGVAMRLYSHDCQVAVIERPPLTHPYYARGMGFVSSVSIDRIEFTSDELALIGAFVGLDAGEPSLGRVHIPGYPGPAGAEVELDFALSRQAAILAGDADCDGVLTARDVPPFVAMLLSETGLMSCGRDRCDFDGNGTVDGADVAGFVLVLAGG